MNFIQKLVEYFKQPEEETADKTPDGVCSLCWGYQKYDGKIRDVLTDRQVAVNNNKTSYMRIEKFVKENIDGYHIKEGVVHVCPDCEELEKDKEKIEKFKL